MPHHLIDIATSRLRIRPMQVDDLDKFHVYRSNPEVALYQGYDVMDWNQCAAFIERQGNSIGEADVWTQFAIINKEKGHLIGDCAIRLKTDPRIAEIGISISHLEQKKGYAVEATSGIMRFLFDRAQVHRIEIITDAENEASLATLKRLGFRMEGHFIENIFFNGKWGSEYQFALLKREWDEQK